MNGTDWKAGIAQIDITPAESIWLGGYYWHDHVSEGLGAKLFANALALQWRDDEVHVLVTADLLGFSRSMLEVIMPLIERSSGIARNRLIINASHTHSGPVTGDLLHLSYRLDARQRETVDTYTKRLLEQIAAVAGSAIEKLRPATLEFGQGLAGIGVNRRRARPGSRHLPGPVDHDVPTLAIRKMDGTLLGAVFGYACHATALNGYDINGDYPGFAVEELERRHPDGRFLFLAGCGGDINPLPRYREEVARAYGMILARAVEDVLASGMCTVKGPLRAAHQPASLPLQDPPIRFELEARKDESKRSREQTEYFLSLLETGGSLPSTCEYAVQVWRFGRTLALIALAGETVVDYSLRFKQRYGWESTWVAAYCDELTPYVPSLRVLREGGYEGADAMAEYGYPAVFKENIEERIADVVERLMKKTSPLETQ